MKIIIKTLLIFSALGANCQSFAKVDLNQLVKSQQGIDESNRKENRVVKKDVFSNVEPLNAGAIDFPVEENCIEIKELKINDDFLKSKTIKTIKKSVSGRCVGIKGITMLAVRIQDLFINSGYITTRIETPEQDLSLNRLTLSVIPGRIEQIIIEDDDVNDWILPFKKNDILNIRDIEQGLEVLQKTPGVNVKINIEPGSRQGFSNVVISVGRKKNWNIRTALNNWGDKGTGKRLVGGVGYLYNLGKVNDVFYLSGTTNAEHVRGGYRNISAYYSIPFGYWDYELFYSDSTSRQSVRLDPFELLYQGKSSYLSLKGSRTVYRDMDKKIALSAELFKRKVNYKLGDVKLKFQKRDMMNAKFGVNYKQNFSGAMLDATLSYQRFLPWFGAEKTPGMKSGDVSPHSNIAYLDVSYTKLFNAGPLNGYYDLRLGGQYTPGSLTLQDRLTLGSRWNVRGFEYSAGLYGDNGVYVQNTFNFMTNVRGLEWYLGSDYGCIFNGESASGIGHDKKLLGMVGGIKGNINTLGYELALSKPLVYPHALDVDNVNVGFNVYFQI